MGKGSGNHSSRPQLHLTDITSSYLAVGTPFIVIKHEEAWWLNPHSSTDHKMKYGELTQLLASFGLNYPFDKRIEAITALKQALPHFPDLSAITEYVTEMVNFDKKTYGPLFKMSASEREEFFNKAEAYLNANKG